MYASSRASSNPVPSIDPGVAGGVDARNQPLSRGFLVAGRAVDLPGQKKAGDALGLETAGELGRLNEVVLNGVCRDAGARHPRGPGSAWTRSACTSRGRLIEKPLT